MWCSSGVCCDLAMWAQWQTLWFDSEKEIKDEVRH